MEFIYTIGLDTRNPKMVINRHIGNDMEDGKCGIDGAQFQSELMVIDDMGYESITIIINSCGGSVMDGMNIYQSILDCKTHTITVNAGIAASISAIIFQAGKERIMYDYAALMYHNPYNPNMDQEDESLKIIKESLVTMISKRSEISEDIISDMMDVTTWINSEDSKSAGLCDRIKSSAKGRELNKLDFKNKFEFVNKNMDLLMDDKKNKENEMKNELTKILNLADDATEEVVYNLVKSLVESQNKKMEDEMEEDVEDKTKVKNGSDSDGINYEELYNELLNKVKESEAKDAENKVNELINSAVKSGKIKNSADTIKNWSSMASKDYENTVSLINDLPINKTAKTIEIVNADQVVNGYKVDPRMADFKEDAVFNIMKDINNKLQGK